MPLLAGFQNQVGRLFGYDAVIDKNRRKPPIATTMGEERELNQADRRKLTGTTQDIAANFAIGGWIIRRHLDFVSQFEFRGRNEDEGLNKELEALMKWWSRPANCDIAGRHPFAKMVRLYEACRTVGGDVGIIKLATGHMQAIENDRIRNPESDLSEQPNGTRWANGVKVNKYGRALAYGVARRINGGSAFEAEKTISAGRMLLHGFFHRYDQVRGVSPIAAALNPLRDVYEGFDYALAKAKVSQMFALAIYSQDSVTSGMVHSDEDEDGKYDVDLGRGPIKLELKDADRAEFLESNQPSSEFREFSNLIVQVAMSSLDIPWNFWQVDATNFFGSRAAWLLYERACKDKRDDNVELLRKLTIWRTQLWIQDGFLTLPRGMTLADIDFEWVPVGMPWWNPVQEITGDVMAVAAGFDCPQRIVHDRGKGDFYDNVDQTAKAMKYAEAAGVPLSFILKTDDDTHPVESADE